MDQQLQAARWNDERHVAELARLGGERLAQHDAGLRAQLAQGAPDGAPEHEFVVALGDELNHVGRALALCQ